jgi:aryl-alcohol dehydrogenase-like predicted oxidoreductase
MRNRALGASGLETIPLVLGGNVFGWTVDEPGAFAILDRFAEAGGTLIDTADAYSAWVPGHRGGESETIIGNWLARSGRRRTIQIATKAGLTSAGGAMGVDLSPAYLTQAVEHSLRRLRVDTIDLLFIHRDDPKAELAPTLRALDALVSQGKVRALGASNFSTARLVEALDICAREHLTSFDVLQPSFHLLDRAFQRELQPLCAANGIAVTPYYGLAAGFLTGKYRTEADTSGRPRGDRVREFLNERGLHMLAVMDRIAAETNASLAQIALAWVAAQPTIAGPIASATSVPQLNDLLGSLTLVLSPAELAALDAAG